MKNLTQLRITVCFLLVFCLTAATAQPRPQNATNAPAAKPKKEILTNATIIELVKLGFSDAIILEKIRQSDHNFDTSLDGLKGLKAARVSDAIIQEMMRAQAPGGAVNTNAAPAPALAPQAGKPSTAVAAPASQEVAPSAQEPGIYLYEKGKLLEINPTTFAGTKSNFLGSALTYGIKKAKMRATVRGASANTVIPNTRPIFYFYFDTEMASPGMAMSGFLSFGATSPGEFVLVKMERKNNSRETVLGEYSAFGASTGTRDKDIQDFAFEKVKPGVFKVIPKANLEIGEYCFYYAGTAGAMGLAGGKLFDFSVTIPAM